MATRQSNTLTHTGAGNKAHTRAPQQIYPPLHHIFVQFHVRDTIHQQAANPVSTLINRYLVPRLIQFIRCSQARRP